ncbi:MAG: hypothetical protein II742_04135 [Clostridia bacterium]|nr:hypothetical protein [Clostridia bacterium]
MNTKKTIEDYVLAGLLAEDKETFLNRLSVICRQHHDELLHNLCEGFVTNATITDEKAAIQAIAEKNSSWVIKKITSLSVCEQGRSVEIRYAYEQKEARFVAEKDAERFRQGYSVSTKEEADDEHPIEVHRQGTSYDRFPIEQPWLTCEYI